MNSYNEIDGDLIQLAREGKFNVIVHGCNCFCTQKAGIAAQMSKVFGTDKFFLESLPTKGNIDKLGRIDYEEFELSPMSVLPKGYKGIATQEFRYPLTVVNAYTQYEYGRGLQLDYEALTLCMRKINHTFPGKHIGLPYVIGCGLAGGDKERVIEIIKRELSDCFVTLVKYKP